MLKITRFKSPALLACLCVMGFSNVSADSPKPKAAAANPRDADQQRARQALIVRKQSRQRGGSYYARMIPRDTDRSQGRERILLFLPKTPLLIEFEIRLDGKPFRELRESLIDEMLAGIPKDDEGKMTWEDAAKAPQFARGRNVRRFDLNEDGFVDRYETRHHLAMQFGGPTFLPTNRVTSLAGSIEAATKKLLDDEDEAVREAAQGAIQRISG